MALIGMAVYSTETNNKDKYLRETLFSLSRTVDFEKHRLMLSVNSHTEETLDILNTYKDIIKKIIFNGGNIGTAEAINKVWQHRQIGEHAVKMDDDIVIEQNGWLDLLEECIEREPRIGQIGLKRTDCIECTWHDDLQYRCELIMLPHKPGQRWFIVEKAKHIMGSCVLHSSALLDKVGYLYQGEGTKYGFDDVLMSYRSELSGFWNCHYSPILIHHIDAGDTQYQTWKEKHAGERFNMINSIVNSYIRGTKPLYYNPFE